MASSAAAARRLLLLSHRHLLPNRHLCSSSAADIPDDGGGGGRVKIFDRDLKRRHRDRAAWAMRETDGFVDAVAENLLDRLQDCRKAFPSALCLGGSAGAVRRLLRGRGGIEKLIMMDMSPDMVRKWRDSENATDDGPETHFVVGDEEFLPITESGIARRGRTAGAKLNKENQAKEVSPDQEGELKGLSESKAEGRNQLRRIDREWEREDSHWRLPSCIESSRARC